MIGGIVSVVGGEVQISNVFNLGKILGDSEENSIGGILGKINSGSKVGVAHGYNIGMIQCKNQSNQNIGGIIGEKGEETFINCYYLIGTDNVAGSHEDYAGIKGVDDVSKFPSVLSIVNEGEEKAFKEDSNNINNGYPILSWQ